MNSDRARAACEKYPGSSEWLPTRNLGDEWLTDRRIFKPFHDRERSAQLARLESFRDLQQGWDSYAADAPSPAAIDSARHVLHVLWASEIALPIKAISPSVEGGVGLVFAGLDKKYADIECFNDGEILAITSEGTADPLVWSLGGKAGSIREAIEKIRTFLND